MRVSAIVPCHNAGQWIAAALRSVEQQTYPVHEIIVIDDSSSDDSRQQIKNTGVLVTLLSVNAHNAAIARNTGIEAATGDWIALLDADDIWYPNHLGRAVELLSNCSDVAFTANHDWIGLKDELVAMPDEATCKLSAPRSGMCTEDFFEITRSGFHFGHSTVLYRRDRLNDVGMFDPTQKRRHDTDLWLRMILSGTWTYDTVKQAGYREGTPDALSRDEAECDLFYLRALVRNLPPHSPRYRQHLARQARRAMGRAFVDGSPEHFAQIKKLSWPHLPILYRSFYKLSAWQPRLARNLVKAKRRRLMNGRAVSEHSLNDHLIRSRIVSAAGLLGALFALPRQRAYRQLLRYDPKQVHSAAFAGPTVETLRVRCYEHGFFLPDLTADVTSAFLELDVRSSAACTLLDPVVEIEVPGFHDAQFLDRTVSGVRLLNVTRLLGSNLSYDRWVGLHGRYLTWRPDSARLHVSRERLSESDRVLVIAPHPDDAEIAAFGVYADTDATIVTLTAGNRSDRYSSARSIRLSLTQTTVARMRVWDSITIPQFGGVAPEKAINLCFPDAGLADMQARPDVDFRHAFEDASTFAALRRVNLSTLIGDDTPCTWKGLVHDLANIIAETKPTTILTPHPWLDPAPDHVYSTAAVCEAIKSIGLREGRMFLYWVHNHWTELWPFGPAGTGVAMLPMMSGNDLCASGFYSHVLSADRQRDKFLALEAMHDIREIELPDSAPLLSAGQRLCSELRALIYGTDRVPTSYLRRAVRPDEVFIVMSVKDAITHTRRVLE
jgi:glycosyltransferase involved in cell wall biosynthesis/LmbE family N-acetylglucosaminyl deacetylase